MYKCFTDTFDQSVHMTTFTTKKVKLFIRFGCSCSRQRRLDGLKIQLSSLCKQQKHGFVIFVMTHNF